MSSNMYTTALTTNFEMGERSNSNANLLARARALIEQAQTDLQAMPAAYSAHGTAVDTQAAANPNDVSWQNLKEAKDNMVNDFIARRNEANSLKAAIDAVPVASG